MKSLLGIINKLSPGEIELFRQLLEANKKGGKNKKLELFDNLLVKRGKASEAGIYKEGIKNNSRQSVYQLKKRLQNDLYSFLMSQPQSNREDKRMFLEMDCHKKLYCFKILIDKNIVQHAGDILDEILSVSSRHQLYSIYLEAVSLKNAYFPLSSDQLLAKGNVNVHIHNLQKSIYQNFYINQYISESTLCLHENDGQFRKEIVSRINERLPDTQLGVEPLKEVNILFSNKDFYSARALLQSLRKKSPGNLKVDIKMQGLIYVELVKSCICLNELEEAKSWMEEAVSSLQSSDAFKNVLLELKYIILLRSDDLCRARQLLETSPLEPYEEHTSLWSRWTCYRTFYHFQAADYKKVIKIANGNLNATLKPRSWIIIIRMLELFSIYQLDDRDWLYYKIESLRKITAKAESENQRLRKILMAMKNNIFDATLQEGEFSHKVMAIDDEHPWHPLSNELLNLCELMRKIIQPVTAY